MRRSIGRLSMRVFAILVGSLAVPIMGAQTPKVPVSTEKEMPMAADATPAFLVAAIHPSDPNATGGWSFESEGRQVKCVRATVMDILSVAYGAQTRQIVGGPSWLSIDRYDVSGVPDAPRVPNVTQLRGMYQKLLTERFHLVIRREMREMPVYAMTVAKGGPHLKVADPAETMNAGNSGNASQRILRITNMSMKDFAANLDFYEDRPVIDRTGLPGNYDFTLRWAYDVATENATGAPPPLFTAIREQLGLRMDAVKGQAEVIVIDHVERPSEN